jgi:small subunit ribosomal protein S13
MSSGEEFKHLVRIHGKDLAGGKKVVVALSDIKGVGYSFASSVVSKLGLDPRARIGTLSSEQIQVIEKTLQDSLSMGLPQWLYNRRKDPESGESRQLLGSDLDLSLKNDLDREKNQKSWRGIRLSLGLKVRGQRTRTTGRHGKTVGVRKAALVAAAKQAGESKEEK